MTKEMIFEKKDGKRIRGKLFQPEHMAGKAPMAIFCHGFGSNFQELMHHGEGFAEAGICCLFFDFCGGGMESHSDGTMQEMTVESECQDLRTVIAAVKKLDYVDPERLFLIGESMGGLVAALVAAEAFKDIRGMVLWYPAFGIPAGARKRYEAGEREVFGILLGENFDAEAKEIDVYGTIPAYAGPVLIIHGDVDPIVPISYSEKAIAAYKDSELIVMPGAAHGYEGADSVAAREHSIAFIKKLL